MQINKRSGKRYGRNGNFSWNANILREIESPGTKVQAQS
jgi:hypothetical protein